MGACESTPDMQPLDDIIDKQFKDANNSIDSGMYRSHKDGLRIKKLLLLGTGSSGKSTILRQLISIYPDYETVHKNQNVETESTTLDDQTKQISFDYNKKPNEINPMSVNKHETHVSIIQHNCVTAILKLLKYSATLSNKNPKMYGSCKIDLNNKYTVECIQYIVPYNIPEFENGSWQENQSDIEKQLQKLGESIEHIWKLKGIHQTYEQREVFSIFENIDFFFDKIREVMNKDYHPDHMDVVKARIRTTGVLQERIFVNHVAFTIVDVGGQRNERKKWIPQFSAISAIIFVSALNHFCSVLFEDETKNGMIESLSTFREVVNYKVFKRVHVIMFLNKDDLFIQRIKQGKSLGYCFNNPLNKWKGPQWEEKYNYDTSKANNMSANDANEYFLLCYENAIKFIQNAYHLQKNDKNKKIYFHTTDATNKENVQKVFWDVQNIVIENHLKKGGLV